VSFRLTLLVALLFGLAVAYLASLNTAGVRLTLAPDWSYDLPVIALIVGAFLGGALLAFVLATLRDVGRRYRDFRRTRQARRTETLSEIFQRGMEAELAGNAADAARAYEEVLRRDPAHPGAPLRLAELARTRGDESAALSYHLQALHVEERATTLLAVADDYRRLGRPDDAVGTYRRVLDRDREHLGALRGLRDVAAQRGRWAEALEAEERLIRTVPRDDRSAEEGWLAGIQYELGRALLAGGDAAAAAARFRDALRTRPDFLPAALALGDTHLKTGDAREAARAWERALQSQVAVPLLSRLERLRRTEGRPARMVALYEESAARHPENLAVAFGLGRVYFELAMLDEAAEQFQKLEVRLPELPAIHAYLGAIFERRGQVREAFEEYRRALAFRETFDWAHHCATCGATQPSWFDRCPSCHRWNTSRP
jgi:lipopolysaccharide biosynthesis regulator YciM